MSDDLEIIHIDGQPRKMGRTLPDANAREMRSGMTSFSGFLESKGLKLIPRSEWKPVSRRAMFGNEFVNDQGQYGACVGYSAAQSQMKERVLRGASFQKLSGAYIYDQINGGRDNGACITDSLGVLLTKGVCLDSDYPIHPNFNTRVQPPSISRFKLEAGLTLTSFDEMVTALLMGLIVQYPIQVGNPAYNSFNSDGVCGFSRGQGNHSVHADGVAFIGGTWLLDHAGTWGLGWGPWKNGRAYHSEQAIMGCAMQDDAYCKIVTAVDDQDSERPPVIT